MSAFVQVSIENGLLLLNGKPLLIRGTNRHEHHPVNGQVMDEATMVQDILLMKQNNFNAVRCSHYPNHPLWYTLCDRYGLYVVDEANIENPRHGADESTHRRSRMAASHEPARHAHGATRSQPFRASSSGHWAMNPGMALTMTRSTAG
ncbi:beta-galactosidase [Citrobacter freundii]|nr:beta-galactosidase [Citrobacter freundii]